MKNYNIDEYSKKDWVNLSVVEWLHLIYHFPEIANQWKRGKTYSDLFKDWLYDIKRFPDKGFIETVKNMIYTIKHFQHYNSVSVQFLSKWPLKLRKRIMDFFLWYDPLPDSTVNYVVWNCNWLTFLWCWLRSCKSAVAAVCRNPGQWKEEVYTFEIWCKFFIFKLLLSLFRFAAIFFPEK